MEMVLLKQIDLEIIFFKIMIFTGLREGGPAFNRKITPMDLV